MKEKNNVKSTLDNFNYKKTFNHLQSGEQTILTIAYSQFEQLLFCFFLRNTLLALTKLN